MALTCPLCRASNEIGPACRRCRADLSLLFAVEANRDAELAAARDELAQGRLDAASDCLRRADGLRAGPDGARLAAVLALVRRDFAEAWRQHQRVRSLNGG